MTSGSDRSYCYSEDSYSEDEEQYSYSSHGAARAVYQNEEDFRRRRCRRRFIVKSIDRGDSLQVDINKLKIEYAVRVGPTLDTLTPILETQNLYECMLTF